MTPQFPERAAAVAVAYAFNGVPSELRRLIEDMSRAIGIPVARIIKQDRDPVVVEARQLVMFEARAAGFSLPVIGRALCRDHSTVLHGIRSEQARRAMQ